ncbi:MAG: hypothetical protein EXQ47_05680 [Bryobacterales bacterium]|nr:hypothetical protein [Bryobacterales bacterium]
MNNAFVGFMRFLCKSWLHYTCSANHFILVLSVVPLSVEENTLQNAPVESATAREREPMLHCPVCSRRLSERKCKLVCEQCGYYMSCADYY